ncbi:hypothetical protein [Shewanella glacialipiscicola]|uniref:Uncharacterized protein n=1 Tax=Shewanella glacialipiscicola TaxID=614069 RepID=A0ABQ6IY26_9GAMM|nr:hypothetical protein [Shewanella glacialipiscicola]MCL1086030.1 hypothetical protein [Shewanella glacialipiscicola]MCU7993720.1 hypothetical protein [Shewanella glacialipiscicola]MCU8025038.1 hypothetical protein [Shewanella glacialipiscicola]GIU10438.1 hypothetical protein TUM4636_17870 [Shewanella glacialipiscicola]GMA80788.1 hypothetical protein GCM10025855_03210 [Shewanella glacialipiscicola]
MRWNLNAARRVRSLFLIVISGLISTTVVAGEVIVNRSSEPVDAFAVRDQVLKDFEWQESIRRQQQIQILQALPLGCITVIRPYRYFSCGEHHYRPYNYQQRELYIEIDPPQQ